MQKYTLLIEMAFFHKKKRMHPFGEISRTTLHDLSLESIQDPNSFPVNQIVHEILTGNIAFTLYLKKVSDVKNIFRDNSYALRLTLTDSSHRIDPFEDEHLKAIKKRIELFIADIFSEPPKSGSVVYIDDYEAVDNIMGSVSGGRCTIVNTYLMLDDAHSGSIFHVEIKLERGSTILQWNQKWKNSQEQLKEKFGGREAIFHMPKKVTEK